MPTPTHPLRKVVASATLALALLIGVAAPVAAVSADPIDGSLDIGVPPIASIPLTPNPNAPCAPKPSTLNLQINGNGTWNLAGGFATYLQLVPGGPWYQLDVTFLAANGTWAGALPPHPIASVPPNHLTVSLDVFPMGPDCLKTNRVCRLVFRAVIVPVSFFDDVVPPFGVLDTAVIDATTAAAGGINLAVGGPCAAPFVAFAGMPASFTNLTLAF